MFLRSRRRIAAGFTLSMGTILVLFAAAVYAREITSQQANFDQRLQSQARRLAAELEYRADQGQWQVEQMGFSDTSSGPDIKSAAGIAYLRWYNADGQLIQYTSDQKPPAHKLKTGFQTVAVAPGSVSMEPEAMTPQLTQLSSQKLWLRQVTLPVRQGEAVIGYLQVAVPLTPLQARLYLTRLWLAVGVPLTLGLIAWVGWLLSGLAMQPTQRSYGQLQRFTADASHELRAPLAAILSNAQVGMLASSEAERQQRLEKIVTSAKGMGQLINNLLFLARHDGQLAPQDLKQVDLATLLKPLGVDYGQLADRQSLAFSAEPPAEPIALRVDVDLLQQAIRNLLDNAFKYTPADGRVTLQCRQRGRWAIIEVIDTGVGIPAQDLSHIFERFYRVDTARARETGGFGLGLSITQQIVEAHGGQLTVKSTPGKGSVFCVELPI